ncbi:MAG: AraC-like DNA-binding protein [Colwellia sp.]|jgi:AraC-like DNA-binding protein
MILQSIELIPINIVQIIFASQMSFAAILIWHFKRYRYLAIFFIFQAILSAMNVLEATNTSEQYYLITPVFTLIMGPILYFLIRSLVNEIDLKGSKKWSHFILPILALPFTEYTQFIVASGTLSLVVYLSLSFSLLTRYHHASKAVSSIADSYQLTWLVRVLVIFAVVTITDLIRMNLQTVTPELLKGLWYLTNEIIFFSISCYLTFKVIRQPTLFDGMASYDNLDEHQSSDDKQAEKELATNIFTSIEAEVLLNEMFKKPRLTVTDLSECIGINVKDISWAINVGNNRNFCDYINSLRIEDVKNKLLAGEAKDISLLEIALSSGFNSKSTFNAVFKKEEGITPSQFMRNNLKA